MSQPEHPNHSGPAHRRTRRLLPRGRRAAVLWAAVAAVGISAGAVYIAWPSSEARPPVSGRGITPSTPAGSAAGASTDPLTGARQQPSGSPDPSLAAADVARRALAAWDAHAPGSVAGPGGAVSAVLRIPALGSSWAEPIYTGVGASQLAAGIGRFPATESPGQVGNLALAGHRSGVAAPPLRNVEAIRVGSTIEVTTPRPLTYRFVVESVTNVAPTDVAVLAQVPGHPTATPTSPRLTLITCWPATGHSRRIVVIARQTSAHGGT